MGKFFEVSSNFVRYYFSAFVLYLSKYSINFVWVNFSINKVKLGKFFLIFLYNNFRLFNSFNLAKKSIRVFNKISPLFKVNASVGSITINAILYAADVSLIRFHTYILSKHTRFVNKLSTRTLYVQITNIFRTKKENYV